MRASAWMQTLSLADTVGGPLWRQRYSNGPILVPFIVRVWVENPGIVCQMCWWFNAGDFLEEAITGFEPPLLWGAANCCRDAVSSYMTRPWHEERHMTDRWNGPWPGPTVTGGGLSTVGRSTHQIMTWSYTPASRHHRFYVRHKSTHKRVKEKSAEKNYR